MTAVMAVQEIAYEGSISDLACTPAASSTGTIEFMLSENADFLTG